MLSTRRGRKVQTGSCQKTCKVWQSAKRASVLNLGAGKNMMFIIIPFIK